MFTQISANSFPPFYLPSPHELANAAKKVVATLTTAISPVVAILTTTISTVQDVKTVETTPLSIARDTSIFLSSPSNSDVLTTGEVALAQGQLALKIANKVVSFFMALGRLTKIAFTFLKSKVVLALGHIYTAVQSITVGLKIKAALKFKSEAKIVGTLEAIGNTKYNDKKRLKLLTALIPLYTKYGKLTPAETASMKSLIGKGKTEENILKTKKFTLERQIGKTAAAKFLENAPLLIRRLNSPDIKSYKNISLRDLTEGVKLLTTLENQANKVLLVNSIGLVALNLASLVAAAGVTAGVGFVVSTQVTTILNFAGSVAEDSYIEQEGNFDPKNIPLFRKAMDVMGYVGDKITAYRGTKRCQSIS